MLHIRVTSCYHGGGGKIDVWCIVDNNVFTMLDFSPQKERRALTVSGESAYSERVISERGIGVSEAM